jgi:hypothetical protein
VHLAVVGRCAAGEQVATVDLPMEDELRRGLGRGGRSRLFATPGERARTSVTKALERAVAAVAAIDPALGGHLADSLVTGTRCCYRPPDFSLRWVVRRPRPCVTAHVDGDDTEGQVRSTSATRGTTWVA